MAPSVLPPAPPSWVDSAGVPRFGSYAGELSTADLSLLGPSHQLSGPERLLREKAWVYALVTTPEVVALAAIVELGYTANAFVTVVDLHRKLRVFDESFLLLPGRLASVNEHPSEGLRASFRTAGAHMLITRERGEDRYRISVEVSRLRHPLSGGLSWEGEVLARGGPPPLAVVSPVAREGKVNVTQKSSALLASGSLKIGGARYSLDGGVAGFDYTHGYLARETEWRWAFAQGRLEDGTAIGVNLVEGFNEEHPEANENGVWIGDMLYPVSRARFSFNRADVFDRWRLRTLDGEVDLTFRPVHAHREHRDLLLVKSRFVQPIGSFSGTVNVDGRLRHLHDVPGVTEDQHVVW